MKPIFRVLLLMTLSVMTQWTRAGDILTIEITQGLRGAIPIAIVPFGWDGQGMMPPSTAMSEIINSDLMRSGYFKVLPTGDMLAQPHSGDKVDFKDWRMVKVDYLVVGQVIPEGAGGYKFRFQLFDVYRGEQLLGQMGSTTAANLRYSSHKVADMIYEKITGIPGAFATRIAYVTSATNVGNSQVSLVIADSDGYNPQPILSSKEPVMSPAWSPDGRRLAYVSLEGKKASIYVQDIYSGQRRQVASYPGLNGAPAWSPDGNQLALTLSKDGNPEIYILDLGSQQTRRLTDHYSIDTEPAWSPDGNYIVFTSDRGGSPQIYRVSARGGNPERITFENNYNARASYSKDGQSLVMVTREQGQFRIGIQDLKRGGLKTITRGTLDESPTFAPNGRLVLYASKRGRQGILAATSVDGQVQQQLAWGSGDVREPAWSPVY